MVGEGSVMWRLHHHWLYVIMVKVDGPVMVMVYDGYWYWTKHRYRDLSYDRLIDRYRLNYPLDKGMSHRRSQQGMTNPRSHYRRT